MAKGVKRVRKAQPQARRKTLAPKKTVAPAKTSDTSLKQQLAEARAQQAATAEILKLIAASPADIQPVLQALAERAARLTDSPNASLLFREGDALRVMAVNSRSAGGIPQRGHLVPIRKTYVMGRAVLRRRTIHVEDVVPLLKSEYPGARENQRNFGFRTVLAVPLMRKGEAIGCLYAWRREVRKYTPAQVALLETFADQAVIAIENVRLFNETKEALELQTASSEVLKSISRTTFDLDAVLRVLIESATHLGGATRGFIFRFDGEVARMAVSHNAPPKYEALIEANPIRLGRGTLVGRTLVDCRPVHIPDAVADPEFKWREAQRLGGFRSVLGVPMMRDGKPIGVIAMWSEVVKPFTDKQIELVTSFADQAVIAIENVRLFNETREALERQTATAEILKVIASSPSSVQPVFDAIVDSAARLFGRRAGLRVIEGNTLRRMARSGAQSPGFGGDAVLPIDRQSLIGIVTLDGKAMQVTDTRAPDAPPYARANADKLDFRSNATAPLVREGSVIGVISVSSTSPGALSAREMALLTTFADQAVIAIENVRLFNETRESLERQTATAEILKVIASSPSDVQPVFNAIAQSAKRLFGARSAAVTRVAGDSIHLAAFTSTDESGNEALKGHFPLPVSSPTVHGRVVRSGKPNLVADNEGDPEISPEGKQVARARGYRSQLTVPMLCEGAAIGTISVARTEAGPFTDHQINLLQTFADQAVIAIQNVRLFNETKEALERQTATAEILKVIASSPTDVQPVFDVIVESAVRLCGARFGRVYRYDGSVIHMVASHGLSAKGLGQVQRVFPRPAADDTIVGRVILARQPFFLKDVERDDSVPVLSRQMIEALDTRSQVTIPIVRAGESIGAITMGWDAPDGFNDQQVALLQTFADQAVIAIENVRLFNETREALEQQTATAEILRVISDSPTDVQPVLDAVARRSAQLCESMDARIFFVDGNVARYAAGFGEFAGVRDAVPLTRGAVLARAIIDRSVVHIEDLALAAEDEYPDARVQQAKYGHRTTLAVPLMREDKAIGGILLRRREVRPYSAKQIELVKTFADQAVIAIQNVRLFNETREALERQTATAEVLNVISSSPNDVQPVFDAIAKSGKRLCNARECGVFRFDGELIHLVALAEVDSAWAKTLRSAFPSAPSNASITSRAILTRAVVQVPDILADPAYALRGAAENNGPRSVLSVPLVREGQVVGAITVDRSEPGVFLDKQVALLETFADQAVIAIENVRLFNETKDALERQTATSEILRVISSSPTDTQPVFDAIAQSGLRLFPSAAVAVALRDGDQVRAAAIATQDPAVAEAWKARFPDPLSRDRMHGTAILDRRPIDVPDAETEVNGPWGPGVKNFLASGNRAITIMPMIRGESAIGAISVIRPLPGPLTDNQIALLQTFADQAVIAIENARLFNETKESLERQTATAEILRVIGGSMTDTQPVFDAIVQNCGNLFKDSRVALWLIDEDRLHSRASNGEFTGISMPIDRESAIGVCVLDGGMIHLPDLEKAAGKYPRIRQLGLKFGYRSGIYAPLLREGQAIGGISVLRRELGAFDDKALALLNTFADQAVIAIENVRLFNETKEALERLTATSEVLKVISSSPTNVQPVFDSIAERAATLCGAAFCSLSRFDGEAIHMAAVYGATPEGTEAIRAAYPMKPGSATLAARVIRDRKPLHIADVQADLEYEGKDAAATVGFRSVLGVPMMREGHLAGAIVIGRAQAGLFPENQVNLLTTFADQAVIAIENVRLFHEIEDKGKQLEVASQHKSNFLASMSHELRTPLNAILGFNEMILGQVYGEVPQDMQEPLNDIQTSGKHLLRLINNVLDLAKIEAGRMELSLQDYSVHDTVASVHSTLRPLAAEKGLEFLANVPNDVPLAYGDGGRIAQCLMNLAGNSLKFTKAGKVEISVETRDELLVYKVTDTGIGIPPDKIGSLFTEFKQTDATIASEYGGTGLGLSISRKFVEMHGGRIWVESELGKGSAFIIEVPLRVKTP